MKPARRCHPARVVGPTRRAVLGALAAGAGGLALAGCGDDDPEGDDGAPRVAVVGAGIAGVAAAWLLDGSTPVDLYEAGDRIGGNVETVEVDGPAGPVMIDAGAQYFHPRVYPTYTRLLRRFGLDPDDTSVGVSEAPGTITLTDERGEALFVSPRLPERVWPLAEPWNARPIAAFQTFADEGRTFELSDPAWTISVDEWLADLPVDEALRTGILLPWIASLNTARIDQARGFSARAAIIFMSRALGDGPLEAASYFTLDEGFGGVLDRMLAETSTVTVHRGRPVDAVQPDGARPRVVDASRRVRHYDAVVIATPGEVAARLTDGSRRAALERFTYYDTHITLHRDPIYAHADPMYRSFLNAARSPTHCEVSMRLSDAVRGVTPAAEVYKSWSTGRDRQPAEVLHTTEYRHVLIDGGTLAGQQELAGLQGRDGIWFAGAWTRPFDAQETALLSAMQVAEALAPDGARLAALKAEG